MNPEYIYILKNKVYGEHFLKIGKTELTPEQRARKISGATGVPESFSVVFGYPVADCDKAEKEIHRILKGYRHNKRREFFVISIESAKRIIIDVCNRINKSSNPPVDTSMIIDVRGSDKSNHSLDKGFEDPSRIIWVNFDNTIRLSSLGIVGISSLSEEQKIRIAIIEEHIDNFFPASHKREFSCDEDPEKEIVIWENIIKAYLKVKQDDLLTEEQEEEAVSLLILRSMIPGRKVLEAYSSQFKSLSRKLARKILLGYEANPVPIGVTRQPNIEILKSLPS